MVEEARYLYSIAKTDQRVHLGEIGIEKKTVYTVPHMEIAAVVHSCEPKPYDTKDKIRAEEWILEHSYVIDQATRRFGSVLPFSFDVILPGDDAQIKGWLGRNYKLLLEELKGVQDKAEYTVQIYYDYDDLQSKILNGNPELQDLQRQMEIESKGKAYLLSKKLDQRLKELVSSEEGRLANRYLPRLHRLVDELIIDGKRSWIPEDCRDLKRLASYSCLVRQENVEGLGEILDEINSQDGFRVRFTGPWAPFSFVKLGDLA